LAIVRESLLEAGFSAEVADIAAQAPRESTYRVYTTHLQWYNRWCGERHLDPLKTSVKEVTDFRSLVAKSNPRKLLSVSTIQVIVQLLLVSTSGLRMDLRYQLTSNYCFLEGFFFYERAVPKPLKEVWNLPFVLDFLAGQIFEPLHKTTFRNLTLKTVFLLLLASGRRVSWIHACHSGTEYTRFNMLVLLLFLSLNMTRTRLMVQLLRYHFYLARGSYLQMINFSGRSWV
jgi:hypothetical protein